MPGDREVVEAARAGISAAEPGMRQGMLPALAALVVGLLVQAGVIATATNADHLSLKWHAYLWDPWFLVWGIPEPLTSGT
jgi:hypothetical protein